MPLQKQTINISFGKGIDTKTDPKQVMGGKLLALQNARLGVLGQLTKRNGYAQTGNTLPSGNFSKQFNRELIVGSQNQLYSLDNSTNTFKSKGTKVAVDLSVSSIVKNSFSQTIPDFAVNGDLALYAFEESSGGVRYSVVNVTTGQEIIAESLATATATIPRCVSLGTHLVLFYIDSGNLNYIAISVPSETVGSPTVVTTAAGVYDVVVVSGVAYVVYGTPGTVYGITLNSSLTAGSPVTIVSQTITAVSVFQAGANLGLGLIYAGGNNVSIYSVSTAFSVLSTTSIDTSSTNQFIRIAGVYNGTNMLAFYESVSQYFSPANDDTYNNFVKFYDGSSSAYFLGSVGLASKAFVNPADSNIYILLAHDSVEQSQYFLTDTNGNLSAKIAAPGNGGGLPAKNIVPSVVTGALTAQVPYQLKELIGAVGGAIFTESGISSATFTFKNPLITSLLGSNLNISGGIMSMYDGINLVEQNFHLFPENLNSDTSLAQSLIGMIDLRTALGIGQLTNAAKYSYLATFEWTDGQGQVHRSAPSDAIQIQTTGGPITWNGASNGSTAYASAKTTIAENGGITPQIYAQIFNQPISAASFPVGGFPAGTLVTSMVSSPPSVNFITNANSNAVSAYQLTTPVLNALTGRIAPFGNSFYLPFIVPANESLSIAGIYGNGFLTFPAAVSQYMLPGDILFDAIIQTSFTITSINGTSVFVSTSLPNPAPRASVFVFQPQIQIVATNGSSSASIATGFAAQINRLYNGIQIVDAGGNLYSIYDINYSNGTFTLFNRSEYIVDNGVNKNWIPSSTGSGGVSVVCTIPPDYLIVKGSQLSSAGPGTGVYPAWIGNAVVTNVSNNLGTVIYTVDQTFLDTSGGDANYQTILGVVNFSSTFITVPTLRLTNKQNVRIVVYRTAANGSIYYRCSDIQNPIINDKTVEYVTFQDTLSDVELVGNDELYTTGGVVDNNSTPAISIMTTYRNRPIAVPSENRLSWWFGQEVIPGTPPQFSQFFIENIDAKGGDITAVQQMDGNLIFFKQDNIFYVTGSGPAPTGTQNDFSEAQLISSDCGCVDQKSVVLMPMGLMFKSAKGIYLLSRNFEVKYIGDAVEAYNSNNVTSATLLESVNEVRFTLDSGISLVYDYYVNQWYTDGNISAADACIYNGIYTYVDPGGILNEETPGVFTDNGAFIPISLLTSWFSWAGLNGFQRAWKLLILGQYFSPHTLNVSFAYDFNPTLYAATPIPVLSPPIPSYEFRVFNKRQKCSAIQISLVETQSSPFGQGMSLSSFAFEVGIKRGLNRLSAGNSF